MARTQGRGWFRTRKQTSGEVVLYCCYIQDPGTGERKEQTRNLGLVSQFPDVASRWTEVGRLGLATLIDKPISALTFRELVERYISSGAIAMKTLTKKKANGSVYTIQHNLESYCLPRWGDTIVSEIKPKVLEPWLSHLHEVEGLAWATISGKIKQAMQGVFKYARKEELLPADFDPFRDIDCEASSDYEAITCTPEQTLAIINQLEQPEFILTLLIAATGLSISEALGLRWADVEYDRNRIVVRRSWVEEIGDCKNVYRKAPVAMHSVLGGYMEQWQRESMYAMPTDWVFASTKLKGKKPRCGSIASQDYLYPAAVGAGVLSAVEERHNNGKIVRVRYYDSAGREVQRFGWHNLRHSLCSWLIENGEDPKTVQGMMRHNRIETTLGRYAHVVDRKRLNAQGEYLNSILEGCSAQ